MKFVLIAPVDIDLVVHRYNVILYPNANKGGPDDIDLVVHRYNAYYILMPTKINNTLALFQYEDCLSRYADFHNEN